MHAQVEELEAECEALREDAAAAEDDVAAAAANTTTTASTGTSAVGKGAAAATAKDKTGAADSGKRSTVLYCPPTALPCYCYCRGLVV